MPTKMANEVSLQTRAVTIQGFLVSIPFDFEVTDTVAVLKPATYRVPIFILSEQSQSKCKLAIMIT